METELYAYGKKLDKPDNNSAPYAVRISSGSEIIGWITNLRENTMYELCHRINEYKKHGDLVK